MFERVRSAARFRVRGGFQPDGGDGRMAYDAFVHSATILYPRGSQIKGRLVQKGVDTGTARVYCPM